MTSEELNAIRQRLAGNPLSLTPIWHSGCVSLLAEIDFLRALLHDLQQDSTAYQRGLEEGVRQERERCAAICEALEDTFETDPLCGGEEMVAAQYCAKVIRGKREVSQWPN